MVGYISSIKKNNILKKIINKIEVEEFENGKKYVAPKLNKRMIKRIKEENINAIVLGKNDKEFANEIYKNRIAILNGKILFKHLIPEIIEYLSKILCINKENMEITIMVNDYSKINLYYINYIVNTIKRINIVTNRINEFKIFANKIYNEKAIVIPVMNNKIKSLANKDIILNIDFCEENLNKYKINRKAILINIEEDILKISKTFSGINVNNYNINKKTQNQDFENNEIYESYIYNMKIEEIQRKIKQDKVKIINFVGRNGPIVINEYELVKNKKTMLDKRKILA